MPPDRRTLDELLADSEVLARETLFDVSADQEPAMLRTWGQMIQAAAQLWISLPPDPALGPDPQVMARLYALGRGISRTVAAGGWPARARTTNGFSRSVSTWPRPPS